jgi:hypothetical protein
MINLHKITTFVIAIILLAFAILYFAKTSKAINHRGIISSLVVKRSHRIDVNLNIRLNSGEKLNLNFVEASPFFSLQRYLNLKSGDEIAYLLSKKNEVLSLHNLKNGRNLSCTFYILNSFTANIFIYIIIVVLTFFQLACFFYNLKFIRQRSSKPSIVDNYVKRINAFCRKHVALGALFFVLFFFLLYQFTVNFNAIFEPTAGLSIQKYLLNFIVFLFLLLLLSLNLYLERKAKRRLF